MKSFSGKLLKIYFKKTDKFLNDEDAFISYFFIKQ